MEILHRSGRLLASLAVAFSIGLTSQASAATLLVDDDGDQCPLAPHQAVQSAVDAAAATDTVRVCAGTYVEQLDIDKDLTIDGDGAGATVIRSPSTLATKFTTPGPNDNKPVVYVHDAGDVTIQDLTVDGLGLGNANYRIIGVAYHQAGGTVQNATIEDVRETPFSGTQHGVGLYALADNGTDRVLEALDNTIVRFQKNGMVLSGGDLTADVSGNIIEGVGPQALNAQNAIQLGGGAGGSIDGNQLRDIEYTPNTFCSAGVLLDSAAAGVDVTDNTLEDVHCGILAQSGTATQISGNELTGARYGITLFDNPADVAGNRITGGDYLDASGTDDTGIYADESADAGHLTYTVNGNIVSGFDSGSAVGIQASDFDDGNTSTVTVNASFNRIAGNTVGAQADSTATLNGEDNWWGCNAGPGATGCDTAVASGGTIDFDPWLLLGLSANPTSIAAGGATSVVTADLTVNTDGDDIGPGFPSGTPVTFATTLGSILSPQLTGGSGTAASALTSGATGGVANVTATLDGQTVATPVTITGGAPLAGGAQAAQGGVGGAKKAKGCKTIKNKKKRQKCLKQKKKKPATPA